MWERLDITFGIETSLKNIFGAVILGGLDRDKQEELVLKKVAVAKASLPRFLTDFTFNIFFNNYAIFYEIMSTLKVKTFTKEQLIEIINTNRDLILDSPYIDKGRYSTTESGNIASDDDILNAITYSLVDDLIDLSNKYVTEEEFQSSCKVYVDWYKNELGERTAQAMSSIMTDLGYDYKKPGRRVRHYQGLKDMREFYNEQMKIIQSLDNESKINTKVINEKWLQERTASESKKDNKALFKLGFVETDNIVGDLRRGHMLGILGPPKGGKTKFANYLVQKALELGLNVCVWPLEGTSEEWESMQTSALIASQSYKELKAKGRGGEMIRLASKDILDKAYVKSPELRKMVYAAETVMATSEHYGTLSFIEGTAYVEDFLDVLEGHWETENRFDVLVIDSLVNIMSKNGMGKTERISKAYMETKNFIANKMKVPALGIMPAQLKQEVVDALRKAGEDAEIDVTAGGESAETIRTPDLTIGLFSSKAERDSNIMNIHCVASRHSAQFDSFRAKCYLECCMFMSNEEEG